MGAAELEMEETQARGLEEHWHVKRDRVSRLCWGMRDGHQDGHLQKHLIWAGDGCWSEWLGRGGCGSFGSVRWGHVVRGECKGRQDGDQ